MDGVRPAAPIGVFDSGVGGLTVARAIMDALPHEELLYLGDTAYGPYGPQPLAAVRERTLACLDLLVAEGAKLLVIACNSSTAAALADARERYDVPVVDVIVPAVRRAARTTRSNRVGVIATSVTVASRAYDDAFAAAPAVELTTLACPRFVDFAERGTISGRQLLGVVEATLAPLQEAGIDTLVLGCTHYPLLAAPISLVMGESVTLVSSAAETAKDVYGVLTDRDLLNNVPRPIHRFTATGDPGAFARLGRRFLGPELLGATLAVTNADAAAGCLPVTKPDAAAGRRPDAAAVPSVAGRSG